MRIRLPIDVKSLFYNVLNDNEKGHTATVSSIISQRNAVNEELNRVFNVDKNCWVSLEDQLIYECTKNSKTDVKILGVLKFDNISINGRPIKTDKSFGMFIKKEIDPTKYQFGRLKLHYPLTFKYSSLDYEIDNKSVINKISEHLNDFAFLVNAFIYDSDRSTLDFDITILGINNIPYSKIFIDQKGTGNKMNTTFHDLVDNYEVEIISLRKKLGNYVNTTNYLEIMENNKTISLDIVYNILKEKKFTDIKVITKQFPYSFYDIEYKEDNIKKYLIVESTSTEIEYFNLTLNKLIFLNAFKELTKIVLITDVNQERTVHVYKHEDLIKFGKKINSFMYQRS